MLMGRNNKALARRKLARAASYLNAGLLAFLTDDGRTPDPLPAVAALPHGSLVILRAQNAERRARLAAAILAMARARGLIVLIADDPVLAARMDAHGIHLPGAKARQASHWRALYPHWIITATAHDLRGLSAGAADAALLSPVFPTASHPGAHTLGAARARLMARQAVLPVLALGGVNARNAHLLRGFAGLAAISAFI
jgi:thiamine-phosphate pyrophosphorylase